MVDRFDLLVAFSVLAVAYILWMDVRPFVKNWLTPATVPSPIQATVKSNPEARPVISYGAATKYYANMLYIVVGNNSEDGRTLRNVKCTLFIHSDSIPAIERSSGSATANIQNGEILQFMIGMVVTSKIEALLDVTPFEIGRATADYDHNIKNGHISFQFASQPNHHLAQIPGNRYVWEMTAVISADDVPAKRMAIALDLENLFSPLSIIKSN